MCGAVGFRCRGKSRPESLTGVSMNSILARIAGLCLLAHAIVGVKTAGAQEQSVYIEPSQSLLRQVVEVPAGRFAAFDLTLTRGSSLTAQFKVRGGFNQKINVWL